MDNLETERLMIRPFVADDLDGLYQILDVELNWAGPSFTKEQRREKMFSYIHAGSFYGYRALVLKGTNTLLGMCAFIPHLFSVKWKEIFLDQLFSDADSSEKRHASLELEIGYALSPRYQGHGYATEAANALINYACDELKVKHVYASTNRKNEGSIKLMKRVGMRTASNRIDPEADWPGVIGVIENDRL